MRLVTGFLPPLLFLFADPAGSCCDSDAWALALPLALGLGPDVSSLPQYFLAFLAARIWFLDHGNLVYKKGNWLMMGKVKLNLKLTNINLEVNYRQT